MNHDYDILDDNKPVQEIPDTNEDCHVRYSYNENQIMKISKLRDDAFKVVKEQNRLWDAYGDGMLSRPLRDFVINNKDEIKGILKELEWKEFDENWKEHFDWYCEVIYSLITRSIYVIEKYIQTNKKLLKNKGDKL